MVKIQVKGKGYHPRIGFLPKLKPFYAEQNTIGWLLNDPMKLELKAYDPDANALVDIDRKNYRDLSSKVFTKSAPAEIPESVYNPTPPPTPIPPGSP